MVKQIALYAVSVSLLTSRVSPLVVEGLVPFKTRRTNWTPHAEHSPNSPGRVVDEQHGLLMGAAPRRRLIDQVLNDRTERNMIKSSTTAQESAKAQVQVQSYGAAMRTDHTQLMPGIDAYKDALNKATVDMSQSQAWAQREVAAAEADILMEKARAEEASAKVSALESKLKIAQEAAAFSMSNPTAHTSAEPRPETLRAPIDSLQAESTSSSRFADETESDGVIQSLRDKLSAQSAESAKVIAAQAVKLISMETQMQEVEIALNRAREQGKSQAARLEEQTSENGQRIFFEKKSQLLQIEVEDLKKRLTTYLSREEEVKSTFSKEVDEAMKARARAENEAAVVHAQAKAAGAEVERLKIELASRGQNEARAFDEVAQARTWAQNEVAAAEALTSAARDEIEHLKAQRLADSTSGTKALHDAVEARSRALQEVAAAEARVKAIESENESLREKLASQEPRNVKTLEEAVTARLKLEKEAATAEMQAKAAKIEIENLKSELNSREPRETKAQAEIAEARKWAEEKVKSSEAQVKAAQAETESLKKKIASQASSEAKALAEATEKSRAWAEKEVAAAKAEAKAASEASAKLLKEVEAKVAANTSGTTEDYSAMEAQVTAKAEKVAKLCMTLQSEVQRLKAELASERDEKGSS
jgi:hypothetical protein